MRSCQDVCSLFRLFPCSKIIKPHINILWRWFFVDLVKRTFFLSCFEGASLLVGGLFWVCFGWFCAEGYVGVGGVCFLWRL